MSVAATIETKLKASLNPEHLRVKDESHRHAGHMGASPEGETHFRVEIVASAFEGVSRLDRQRRVHEILAEELSGSVHALALKTKTPSEAHS